MDWATYNAYPFADGFNGAACEAPAGTTTHSANCANAVGNTTDVGSYTTSSSAYGTFDQGGNVGEWTETFFPFTARIKRGSFWTSDPEFFAASFRIIAFPGTEVQSTGFRVAMVPEPGTSLLVMGGVLGMASRRRRRLH